MDSMDASIGLDGYPETQRDNLSKGLGQVSYEKRELEDKYKRESNRFVRILERDLGFAGLVFETYRNNNPEEINEIKENVLGERLEFVNWWEDLIKRRDEIEGIENKFVEDLKKYVIEEIETGVIDVSSRIDFNRLVDHCLANNPPDLSEIKKDLDKLNDLRLKVVSDEGLEGLRLDELSDTRTQLFEFKDKLNNRSLIRGELSLSDLDLEIIEHADTLAVKAEASQLNFILHELEEFEEYSVTYRSSQDILILEEIRPKLNQVKKLLSEDDSKMDFRFFNSVKEWINLTRKDLEYVGIISQSETTLATKARERKMVNKKDSIKKIEFLPKINMEKFPIESHQLINDLTAPLPWDFIKNVRTLIITDIPKLEESENSENVNMGLCRHAFYEGGLMSAEITIRVNEEYLNYNIKDLSIRITENTKKVGWHEIGHATHNTLSLGEMKTWEEVLEKEGVHFSDFLPKKNSGEEDLQKLKREDFSETFAAFLCNPYYLKVVAPLRFSYMYNLFMNHSSESELEDMNLRISTNTTDQLAHWNRKKLEKID